MAPHAVTGPYDDVADAARHRAPRLRARDRGGRLPRRPQRDARGGAGGHRRLLRDERLVRPRRPGPRDEAQARPVQGQGLRHHDRPVGRHRRRARRLPRRGRLPRPRAWRSRSTATQVGADRSGHMGWSFEQLVSHASRASWVKAGEVLASGTCASGSLAESWGRTGPLTPPPLQVGDVVEMTIEQHRHDPQPVVADDRDGAAASRPRGAGSPRRRRDRHDPHVITTVDPATGEDWRRTTRSRRGRGRRRPGRGARGVPGVVGAPLAERLDLLRAVGKLLTERREEYAAPDHRRDGQAARRGAGRDRQVRLELRGRRRARRPAGWPTTRSPPAPRGRGCPTSRSASSSP